ncbi:VIT1/CCC1 transporter family protein [Ferroacidibacillus organovorans]|uniref:VIT family protein n=1 Tax=Ferroacidibacillus organovorans TaxID=1765683 RepID=A0A101XTU2_9BACL|nr:VIT1/CCC1 transporter family protein [Ferroacidibacillus organovorans]KUO97330.1 hypothetical protein ATW55_04605 [Ferroacidibacillus organovorans]
MSTASVTARLDDLLGKQKKVSTPDWVGDAVYGANDGLGAIFGIIAGVAGYTAAGQTILISGLFGALASTLSMAAGAWLATKSENEMMESGFRKAKEDITRNPHHEREILSLTYQSKGFEEDLSEAIIATIVADETKFVEAVAQEKYGVHESQRGNPWSSSLYGGVSTLIGGIIPLIPFFFLQGHLALIVAAIVSILAHFLVGAAKSVVTVRSWWSSGLEMTVVGILVGTVSYGLGLLGSTLIG